MVKHGDLFKDFVFWLMEDLCINAVQDISTDNLYNYKFADSLMAFVR
jgi:hypothetical protein